MKKIKICWVAPYPVNNLLPDLISLQFIPPTSGMWLVNLSKSLVALENIELHIICNSSKIPYNQIIIKDNIIFHVFKYNLFSSFGFHKWLPLNRITWYKKIVKKYISEINNIKPDIIHAHGVEEMNTLPVLQCNYPHIISIQGIIHEIIKVSPSIQYFCQLPIEKECLKKGVNFGCRTEWDKNYVTSQNRNAIIHYMPEAIAPCFFEKKWKGYANIRNLVFVGSLLKRKGIETLIDAVILLIKDFSDIKITVIGNGKRKYVEYIKHKLIKFKIIDNFEFKGFLNSNQIADILSKSGIYIHPSYIDNSPNSLCEAMAVGMPVVASKVGGIPSLVSHETNGLLFEMKNINELYQNIKQIFNDEKLAKRISNQALIDAYQRHFPNNVAKQTLDIYNKIINQEDKQ